MGTDGVASRDALGPSVAHDPRTDEYLVTWGGDDGVDQEFEIFGQRVTGAGAEIGTNDIRISDAGPDGSASFSASAPSVAYSPSADEWVVAWNADDNVAP